MSSAGGIIVASRLLLSAGTVLFVMDCIGFGIYGPDIGLGATLFASGMWSAVLLYLAGGFGLHGGRLMARGCDGKTAGLVSMIFSILSSVNTLALAGVYVWVIIISFIIRPSYYAPYVIVHTTLYVFAVAVSITGAVVIGRLACGSYETLRTTHYVTTAPVYAGPPQVIVYGQPQHQPAQSYKY